MRKLTKGLLVAVTVTSLGWSLLSSLYTHTVSGELAALKRESHSDTVYLRCRLRELESELLAGLMDRLIPPAEAVAGAPGGTDETVGDATAYGTAGDDEPVTNGTDEANGAVTDSDGAVTETVTLHLHRSPETRPAAGEVLYHIGVHEGRIGLFDAAGNVVETVNVFVMTLPDADRAALEVGIPVASVREARALMATYE